MTTAGIATVTGDEKGEDHDRELATNHWGMRWVDSIALGANTMSQRKLGSIESRGGRLRSVRKLAKGRVVHLVRFSDEHGNDLIAASNHPFKFFAEYAFALMALHSLQQFRIHTPAVSSVTASRRMA